MGLGDGNFDGGLPGPDAGAGNPSPSPVPSPSPTPVAYNWDADPLNLSAIKLTDARFAGKYDNVRDLEKSYHELTQRFTTKTDTLRAEIEKNYLPPEQYDLKEIGIEEEQAKVLADYAKKYGLNQEKFKEFVKDWTEQVQGAQLEARENVWRYELGGDKPLSKEEYGQRLKELVDFGIKTFGEEKFKEMDKAGHFNGIAAVKALNAQMLAARQATQVWSPGQGGNAGTPDIGAKIANLMSNPGYMDASHPEHNRIQAELTRLYQIKHGEI